MKVRTRMAPSPTGEYHIGGIRTYLYNYAWAKKNNGQMILRIEDTDKNREVSGALERMLDVIKSFGLSWDEGPEVSGPYKPYIQSQRLDLYKDYAQRLIELGHAYYCFCTPERLEHMRQEQKALGLATTKYDRHCLQLTQKEINKKLEDNEPYVIRLKMPEDKVIVWDDLVLGNIEINTAELDDQILLKSDGFPTYHLAVVVDDHMMEINPVLRGVEWIPSTPKQIVLFNAFGWEIPRFGHLPNLKEAGATKKMSKRYGEVYAINFLQNGYLPEALLNFVMFLGWNPGTEKEIYTLDEFIQDFSIERIHKTDLVVFDREKLLWMNGYYIRNTSNEALLQKVISWKTKFDINFSYNLENIDKNHLLLVIGLVKEKLKTLAEFDYATTYFFNKPQIDKTILVSYAKDKTKEILSNFSTFFEDISDWRASTMHDKAFDYIKEMGYTPKEAFMTIRIALSGRDATPQLFDILEVLGKAEVLERIKIAQHTL